MQPEPALIARHLERSFGTGEAAARVLSRRVAGAASEARCCC